MSVSNTPYIGEIGIAAFNYAPNGWALCNGQLLAIRSNPALFSILGTVYGGDGRTNFGLPNFQGLTPIGSGLGPGSVYRSLGESGGVSEVNLSLNEMPAHTHPLGAGLKTGSAPHTANGVSSLPATSSGTDYLYSNMESVDNMAPLVANLDTQNSMIGGNQPHTNMQPYLVVNFIIAIVGVFPSRA